MRPAGFFVAIVWALLLSGADGLPAPLTAQSVLPDAPGRDVTVKLCANCHELHHLMYNALVRQTEYSQKLVLHALFSGKIERETAARILGWCLATIRYEAANGWIEGGRDTREWVEKQLNWSAFLQAERQSLHGT